MHFVIIEPVLGPKNLSRCNLRLKEMSICFIFTDNNNNNNNDNIFIFLYGSVINYCNFLT